VNLKLLILGVATLIFLAFIFMHGFGHDPHAVPFLLTGKQAPSFKLQYVDDENKFASLADFAGKPLIINFWATWCEPCQAEHPVLEWGYEHLHDRVQFAGVIYQDDIVQVRKFLRTQPTHIMQLFDPSGVTAVDYALAGVPETYFISADGVIRYKHVGPIDAETLITRGKQLLENFTMVNSLEKR